MKKLLLFFAVSVVFAVVAVVISPYFSITPQEKQARSTVKRFFKRASEGASYKPIAWGNIEYNAVRAGTGTKNPLFDETGTPPSLYSMTHRLQMRNGFGTLTTFDIRVFFTDERCVEWAGMEYMAHDDPNRYLMDR